MANRRRKYAVRPGHKQCPDCVREGIGPKPLAAFYKGNDRHGRAGYCIPHHTVRVHLRRQQKPLWVTCLYNTRSMAKRKNRTFALTPAWAAARWTGKCELTGLKFERAGQSGPVPRSPSIDRVDSTKGYTPDNCRFILAAVNAFRLNGSDAQMYRIANALLTKRKLLCGG